MVGEAKGHCMLFNILINIVLLSAIMTKFYVLYDCLELALSIFTIYIDI